MLVWLCVAVLSACLLVLLWPWRAQPRQYTKVVWQGHRIEGLQVRAPKALLDTFTGLRNHADLALGQGLLLQVGAIHTRGMAFELDLLFLDHRGMILAVHSKCKPQQACIRGPRGTRMTLELRGGAIAHYGFEAKGVCEFYE